MDRTRFGFEPKNDTDCAARASDSASTQAVGQFTDEPVDKALHVTWPVAGDVRNFIEERS
jgi:hypothetical protein